MFIFDQSSCHTKAGEKALVAKNILVKDGGPRRVQDTEWKGSPQVMVTSTRCAKGLCTILTERGMDTTGMKADKMRNLLSNHTDFLEEKTQVER